MKPTAEPFAKNSILFGRDETTAIVSVEPCGADAVTVYRRPGKTITAEAQPIQPFLWLTEQVFLQGFDRKVSYEMLTGPGELKVLARFQSWPDFQAARNFLRNAPSHAPNDPDQQYLMAEGRTLFKGMRFDQLVRMQVTLAGDAVQLCDQSGWQREVHKLDEFVALIRERDPDVIEGHDIFRVTLPALVARARAAKSSLKLGRDGSVLRSRSSRVQIAEKTIAYPKFEIHGRHVVDTFLLAQFHDISTRELEGFSLKEVAAHFGVAPDVTGIGKISAVLSPSYFIQAQIFPYNFQDIVVRGNATKIDALFLREYLHQRHAIPQLGEPHPFAGGYTDVFAEGIIRNVWHCDVQSLYPSLLLAEEIKPRGDELNLFLPLLRDLREFRLRAKTAARKASAVPRPSKVAQTSPSAADVASQAGTLAPPEHYEALQLTFKILINSFYGYLGFSQAHFADFDAAEKVTARGRETLKLMLDWLRQRGAHVIEIDTDGLYFVPPPGIDSELLESELQAALPRGVDVEIDGQFPAMFSYKMKNYALLDTAGGLHVTGSALRSRGLEKFQRQFLEEMLALALRGEVKKVPQRYEETCEKIEQRKFPIELLAKTETLQDSLEAYREKIAKSARNRNAAYELALKSGRLYQPGDPITYYVTGDGKRVSVYENCKLLSEWNESRRDENIEYYLDKLKTLYKKFAPLLKG